MSTQYTKVTFFVIDKGGNSKGLHSINVYENPQTCPGFNLIASRLIKDYVNRNFAGTFGTLSIVRSYNHYLQSNIQLHTDTIATNRIY